MSPDTENPMDEDVLSRHRKRPAAMQFTSPAEQDWRQEMREAGYPVAPKRVPYHFSGLILPGGDKLAAESAYRKFADSEPENIMALEGLVFLLQHRGAYEEALCHVENLELLRQSSDEDEEAESAD